MLIAVKLLFEKVVRLYLAFPTQRAAGPPMPGLLLLNLFLGLFLGKISFLRLRLRRV
jgi:hypothetical protein